MQYSDRILENDRTVKILILPPSQGFDPIVQWCSISSECLLFASTASAFLSSSLQSAVLAY